jgi:hypothetical protein
VLIGSSSRLFCYIELTRFSQANVVGSFRDNFYKQPNFSIAQSVEPYPYRIGDTPLYDEHGTVNEVYFNETPPPQPVPIDEESNPSRVTPMFLEKDQKA